MKVVLHSEHLNAGAVDTSGDGMGDILHDTVDTLGDGIGGILHDAVCLLYGFNDLYTLLHFLHIKSLEHEGSLSVTVALYSVNSFISTSVTFENSRADNCRFISSNKLF